METHVDPELLPHEIREAMQAIQTELSEYGTNPKYAWARSAIFGAQAHIEQSNRMMPPVTWRIDKALQALPPPAASQADTAAALRANFLKLREYFARQ